MKTNAHEKHDEKVEVFVCIGVDRRNDKETLQKNCHSKWREKIEKNSKGTRKPHDFHKGNGI